ncbi:MAG: hypothetical protein CMI60_15145 [Parvibaculum sp.]|jgi:flavin-dependent dehydrogenase|nr:hypothetical protein [Parvibaculum sp.]|tara:strand:- start:3204 stop:4364 length:1161 start_codon:yes stop_codon:yes gene_type:complete
MTHSADAFTTPKPDNVPIIGAGPAGLSCAIVLARSGVNVTVYDRRPRVGARFHNDFQGLENWTHSANILVEMGNAGIEATFDHIPVTSGIAFDAWNKRYTVSSEEPLYYLVRRGDGAGTLDQGLLEQARSLGVDVRFNENVKEAPENAVLSIGPRTADVIAVGYVFDTDMADGNWVCFNNGLAPHGYAYLLVANGRGTVATCLFSGFKNQNVHLERTVKFFETHAALTMKNPKPFGGYGNIRLPRSAIQGNKPVIGEHAGFQDSLAGFGMSYAIRSGVLAAHGILGISDYHESWRRELLPLLKTSIANRFLFNIVGERGRRMALARISGSDSRRTLQNLYNPWWMSKLVLPFALRFFKAPLKDKSCDHVGCSCVWCEHGISQAEKE